LFKKKKENIVLILGTQYSGKTTLFYQLKLNKFRECAGSMTINKDVFSINEKKYEFYDITENLIKNKTNLIEEAKKIIFLIDSFEVSKEAQLNKTTS
jgi:ABC-type phosphate/phosphonate transport system ATPase subunit